MLNAPTTWLILGSLIRYSDRPLVQPSRQKLQSRHDRAPFRLGAKHYMRCMLR